MHVLVVGLTARFPGIHLNFVLILIAPALLAAFAGAIIGVPTLRLRGDYIAIVTLAFGEIIRRVAINGPPDQGLRDAADRRRARASAASTPPYLPGIGTFSSST